MPLCLIGLDTAPSLPLPEQGRVRIPLRQGNAELGHLELQVIGAAWVWANRSQMLSRRNGIPSQGGPLGRGDEITLAGLQWRVQVASEAPSAPECIECQTSSPIQVVESHHPTLPQGQSPVEPAAALKQRSSRRLSASTIAVGPRPLALRLWEKMGGMLGRKDQRLDRLGELERERETLLVAAGRAALEADGGVGLPRGLLAALGSGQTVTLRRDHLQGEELDEHRLRQRRLHELDAAIMLLREDLGMPPLPALAVSSSGGQTKVISSRSLAQVRGAAAG